MTARSTLQKLGARDPAWGPSAHLWGVGTMGVTRKMHRISRTAVAADGRTHARTECGSYLTRVAFHDNVVDDIDECDDCLMGGLRIHVAYLYEDTEGTPIYAGYSGNLPKRIGDHRRYSSWWTPDLRLSYTIYPTEAEALAAETELVLTRGPQRNRRASTGRPSKVGWHPTHALQVEPERLVQALADLAGVAVEALTDTEAARILGVGTNTFWRARTDPDHAISASLFVAITKMLPHIPKDELFKATFTADLMAA